MSTTIEELITVMRGHRTWRQLSEDCGGIPTAGRLQQMSMGKIEAFPTLDNIRGLAHGLDVKPRHVIQAVATTLGLWDKHHEVPRSQMLPEMVDTLTEDQMRTIHGVIREYAKANARSTNGE